MLFLVPSIYLFLCQGYQRMLVGGSCENRMGIQDWRRRSVSSVGDGNRERGNLESVAELGLRLGDWIWMTGERGENLELAYLLP